MRNSRNSRKIDSLIENLTSYQAEYAEMFLFETFEVANNIAMSTRYPIVASMINGEKVMRTDDKSDFEFLPGQSIVIPPDKEVVIDFPTATMENPTQCLALAIDDSKIQYIVEKFNQKITENDTMVPWSLTEATSSVINDINIDNVTKRLLNTFVNGDKSKDILINIMIEELIVRLLQTNAKHALLLNANNKFSDTRIGYVMNYLKENLTDKEISVEFLAEKANMSLSNFHKHFKNTIGMSPIDYINSEKINFAKKLIKERPNLQISEIAYKSGFNSVNYFDRQFKKAENQTPNQYKQKYLY